MLSRIAESFFWLGRYLERAEATARMLAEHHQLLVEDQSVSDDVACAVLLDALSLPHESITTGHELVSAVVGTEQLPRLSWELSPQRVTMLARFVILSPVTSSRP